MKKITLLNYGFVIIVFLLLSLTGRSQQRSISGVVQESENNAPLEGATISVGNNKLSTITDSEGRFNLSVPTGRVPLNISFVGYETKTETIGNEERNIIIVLNKSTTNLLGEVVVVGYGSQKRSDITGAVSSVKGTDLVQLPVLRADQALQGRAAGVAITNTDGAPGGSTTIRIRGANSITGGNNALVVIDGFQGGDLSTINPNEIASIEVLKDASATAIYGSRGANGVILVNTKRGIVGTPVIDYSYSFGRQKIAHKIDLMNAGDYAQISNDWAASQNINTPTPFLPFSLTQIDSLKKTKGTDWQDEIYRNANLQLHQLSLRGGSNSVKYFFAGGYSDQEGLIVNTNFKRYTLRANADIQINKWLKTGVDLNAIKDKGNVPAFGEGTRFVDILAQAVNAVLRFDPITPVLDADGNYSKAPSSYGDPDVWNPVATVKGSFNESNSMTTNVNTFLEFKILSGLTFRVEGAASVVNFDKKTYYNHLTRNGSLQNGSGQLTIDKSFYYQNSNILTYDKTFNDVHHLTFTGVAEQQSTNSSGSFIDAQGFFSDATGIDDLGGASQINERSSYITKRSINSFLGRVNYGYNNKYLFTVSYRADGSSVFGANNKWGYFPSAALAWRASEEGFIKNVNLFSELKFRGSWGRTGNQAISPYRSLDAIGSGFNYPYNGNTTTDIGFSITQPANPNLKWESTTQTNIGVDMGFLEGRLTTSIDIYRKVTDNLLLNRPIPSFTGFTTLLDNVGSVENKGLEVTVAGDPVRSNDFRWNTAINISMNRSKVLKLLNDLPMAIRTSTGGGYQIWSSSFSLMYLQVGQPFGQMQGYINEGTWKESEIKQAKEFGQLPGDPKWKDINGDGQITRADVTVIGNSTPKYVYGWNNNMSYKNFSLSFLIQGTVGNDIFNATRIKTEKPSNGLSTNLNNRWTPDNQNTDVPAFIDQVTRRDAQLGPSKVKIGVDQRSSRWIEDGSYLRMKNITLGYQLPKSFINKVGLTNSRLYISASNILTITKYTGYDPEVSSFNAIGDVARGIDMSNYPSVKTITLGINLTF